VPKVKKKAKRPDQHTSGFLIRLPECYRDLLLQIKQKEGRPISVSVRRGVDAELRANGIQPPLM